MGSTETDEEKRLMAAEEIVESERTYLDALRCLIEVRAHHIVVIRYGDAQVYIKPIKASGVISVRKQGVLFSNVEAIYAFSERFHVWF